MALPRPPLSSGLRLPNIEFDEADSLLGDGDPYGINQIDWSGGQEAPVEEGLLGKLSSGLGTVLHNTVGLPKQGIDWIARSLTDEVEPEGTTAGQILEKQLLGEADPNAGFGTTFGRTLLRGGLDLATDPLTYTGLGVLGKAGKAVGLGAKALERLNMVEKVAHPAFQAQMGLGVAHGLGKAVPEIYEKGFTPRAGELLGEAAISGGGLLAPHLLKGRPDAIDRGLGNLDRFAEAGGDYLRSQAFEGMADAGVRAQEIQAVIDAAGAGPGQWVGLDGSGKAPRTGPPLRDIPMDATERGLVQPDQDIDYTPQAIPPDVYDPARFGEYQQRRQQQGEFTAPEQPFVLEEGRAGGLEGTDLATPPSPLMQSIRKRLADLERVKTIFGEHSKEYQMARTNLMRQQVDLQEQVQLGEQRQAEQFALPFDETGYQPQQLRLPFEEPSTGRLPTRRGRGSLLSQEGEQLPLPFEQGGQPPPQGDWVENSVDLDSQRAAARARAARMGLPSMDEVPLVAVPAAQPGVGGEATLTDVGAAPEAPPPGMSRLSEIARQVNGPRPVLDRDYLPVPPAPRPLIDADLVAPEIPMRREPRPQVSERGFELREESTPRQKGLFTREPAPETPQDAISRLNYRISQLPVGHPEEAGLIAERAKLSAGASDVPALPAKRREAPVPEVIRGEVPRDVEGNRILPGQENWAPEDRAAVHSRATELVDEVVAAGRGGKEGTVLEGLPWGPKKLREGLIRDKGNVIERAVHARLMEGGIPTEPPPKLTAKLEGEAATKRAGEIIKEVQSSSADGPSYLYDSEGRLIELPDLREMEAKGKVPKGATQKWEDWWKETGREARDADPSAETNWGAKLGLKYKGRVPTREEILSSANVRKQLLRGKWGDHLERPSGEMRAADLVRRTVSQEDTAFTPQMFEEGQRGKARSDEATLARMGKAGETVADMRARQMAAYRDAETTPSGLKLVDLDGDMDMHGAAEFFRSEKAQPFLKALKAAAETVGRRLGGKGKLGGINLSTDLQGQVAGGEISVNPLILAMKAHKIVARNVRELARKGVALSTTDQQAMFLDILPKKILHTLAHEQAHTLVGRDASGRSHIVAHRGIMREAYNDAPTRAEVAAGIREAIGPVLDQFSNGNPGSAAEKYAAYRELKNAAREAAAKEKTNGGRAGSAEAGNVRLRGNEPGAVPGEGRGGGAVGRDLGSGGRSGLGRGAGADVSGSGGRGGGTEARPGGTRVGEPSGYAGVENSISGDAPEYMPEKAGFGKGYPGKGWKLHLATDKPEAVSTILREMGLQHKVGRSDQQGKDVTVYVGAKDAAVAAAQAISERAGNLLNEPHSETLRDDVVLATKVAGRFDAGRDGKFNQYGAKGFPLLNEDVQARIWDKNNFNQSAAEARAQAALVAEHGEFYTGKPESPWWKDQVESDIANPTRPVESPETSPITAIEREMLDKRGVPIPEVAPRPEGETLAEQRERTKTVQDVLREHVGPKAEQNVEKLRIFESREGAPPVRLSRETRMTLESQDPKVLEYLLTKDDNFFINRAARGQIDPSVNRAWESRIKAKEEAANDLFADLKAARAERDQGKIKKLEQQYEIAADDASNSLYHYVELGTLEGRSLQARAAHMLADNTTPSGFLTKVIREFSLNKKQAAELNRLYREDPLALGDAIRTMRNPTVFRKLLEYQKAGMVSAIPTHIANIAGNAGEFAARLGETYISGLIDNMKGGTRRPGSEVHAELKGAMDNAIPGLRRLGTALREIMSLAPEGVDVQRSLDWAGGMIGKGGKFGEAISKATGKDFHLGRAVRIPLRMLGAVDDFFQAVGHGAELGKLSYREAVKELGAKADPTALRQRADAISAEVSDLSTARGIEMARTIAESKKARTFQEDPIEIVRSLNAFRQKHPSVQLALPFTTTPANILRRVWQRSPAGFAKVWKDYKAGAFKGDTAALADAVARPILGSALFGGFVAAANTGLLTGSGPSDPDELNLLRSTGWQPYSVVINNSDGTQNYIPFNRFEPISSLLSIAADWGTLSEVKKEEQGERVLGSLISNLVSKTYLRGLSDAAMVISDPKKAGGQFLRSVAGTVVPNIITKTGKAFDPTIYDTKASAKGFASIPQGMMNQVIADIPGLAGTLLEPKLDKFGKPVEMSGNAVGRAISPFPISTSKPNAPLVKELLRVGVTPPSPKSTLRLDGVDVPLTPKEKLIMAEGQTELEKALSKLTKTAAYHKLPDTRAEGGKLSKEAYIRSTIDGVNARTRKKVTGTREFLTRFRQTRRQVLTAGRDV